MKTKFVTINSRYIILALLSVFMFNRCMEVNTSDAEEAFLNWSGEKPPIEIKLLNGQYWQSPHWTKEYILYLKFKATNDWWNDFLKQNSISKDIGKWTVPSDAPKWFTPTENTNRYGGGNDFDQGSRYFRDSTTQICYIYEIQL